RFSDFRDHLGIPRAVLTERLNFLVEHGILERGATASGRDEYILTDKGERLWPGIWSLMAWGNEFYMPQRRRRPLTHTGCGGVVGPDGTCPVCGARPGPDDLTIHPQPTRPRAVKTDPASQALKRAHPLLTPIHEASPAQPVR